MWKRTSVVTVARTRPRQAFVGLVVAFGLLLGAWAFATPLGATPDEWAHIFRASGVVHGQIMISAPGPVDAYRGDPVRIPQTLAKRDAGSVCYRHRPGVPVTCAKKITGSQQDVRAYTTAGRYPPFYYAIVGLPLLLGTHGSTLYLMRLIAVLLSSLLLASGALAALRLRGGLTITGFTVAITPMVAYLGAMVNPNGLEIAAGAALWTNLLLWLESPPASAPRRSGLVGSVVAAVSMVLLRTASIAWVAGTLVALLVLVRRNWLKSELLTKRMIKPFGIVVAAVVIAGIWALWSRELQIAPIRNSHFQPTHYTLMHNAARAYHQLEHWLHQAIADFGWLDTPVSSAMYSLYVDSIYVLIGAMLIGFARGRWRPSLAAVAAFGITALATMFGAASQANELRITFWQGRYSLPLAVGVPILLAYAAGSWRGRTRWIAGVVSAVTVTFVGVVHVDSFLRFFQRNSVGIKRPFSLDGGWQPYLGIRIWIVVLVVALLLFAVLSILAAISRDETVPESTPAAPGALPTAQPQSARSRASESPRP